MHGYNITFLLSCMLFSSTWKTALPFQPLQSSTRSNIPQHASLYAKSSKPKKKGGGGFGAASTATNKPKKPLTISADKGSLEKQWDTFTSITDLEIRPPSDDDDDDFFKVVDVFVRCNVNGDEKWFRIGKVCTNERNEDEGGEYNNIHAALTLQKGLIFWTAVHMRRELVAAGGKSGAASLELGFTDATMNMGSETDGPVEEGAYTEAIQLAQRVSIQDTNVSNIGFRPDWNPPGFTYKRRESAAMKKKKGSTLDDIKALN